MSTKDIQGYERTEAQALQSTDLPENILGIDLPEGVEPPSRQVYLFGEVNEESAERVLREIHQINDFDMRYLPDDVQPEPIILYVNSYGGIVTEALAIIDAMDSSPAEVWTVVTGKALSCGLIIALSGAKRFATKNANYMFHSVQAGSDGGLHYIGSEYAFAIRLQKQLIDIAVERTNIPKSKLKKWSKDARNFYFSSKKAKKWSVVDEII